MKIAVRHSIIAVAILGLSLMASALAQTAITPPPPNPTTPQCVSGSGTSTTYSNCTPANPFPVTTTTAGSAVAPAASAALVSSAVLKGSANGTLFGFQANFVTCATYPCWVMVFNATSLPANGAVTPVAWYQASQNSTVSVEYNPPLSMSTGVTVGCSTTGPFTLTATTQCAISGQAQ